MEHKFRLISIKRTFLMLISEWGLRVNLFKYVSSFHSLRVSIFSLICFNVSELELSARCRECETTGKWRCDNGWCIPRSKLYDGIPDCPDSSDEHTRESQLCAFLSKNMVKNGLLLLFFSYISMGCIFYVKLL